jgi:phage gp36-like protein
MAYCVKQDLIDRFGETELIQRTGRGSGVIDDTVLAQAIDDADAEINGYLTAYKLPLSVIPADFIRKACDITRFYLHQDAMTDRITAGYNNAIKYLSKIANGTISIAPAVDGSIAVTSEAVVQLESSVSVFGRNG